MPGRVYYRYGFIIEEEDLTPPSRGWVLPADWVAKMRAHNEKKKAEIRARDAQNLRETGLVTERSVADGLRDNIEARRQDEARRNEEHRAMAAEIAADIAAARERGGVDISRPQRPASTR